MAPSITSAGVMGHGAGESSGGGRCFLLLPVPQWVLHTLILSVHNVGQFLKNGV